MKLIQPPPKTSWHSKTWWTSLGVFVAIISLLIAWFAWRYPQSPTDQNKAGAAGSSAVPTTATASSTRTESSTPDATATTTTATRPTTTTTPPSTQAYGPDQAFLSDIPKSFFVRSGSPSVQRGPATVAGKAYASSYSYRFTNCGNCTYETEFNLPGSYVTFKGTLGLTDESRHDSTIDGIVYVSIHSQTGDQLLAPQKVEFPNAIPFEIPTAGVTRLRLTVSQGTNSEVMCWCDAVLTK